jgi:predicted lipoprotein with Yx(FWY)xxD motif
MTGSRRSSFLAGVAAVPLVALAVVGCGGGGSSNANASPPPKTAAGQPATVGVANTSLGKVLVNSKGLTLYLFKKDSGTTSACSGACASAWPPLRAKGKPTVGAGVTASKVGTTSRSDGSPQVTYNGHPLYLYQGDSKPGDTNGQGISAFGAGWFALSASGNQVAGQASSGGGGLGY